MAQQLNICQTEYKSMFDTYQERTYSLRPSMACCMESWVTFTNVVLATLELSSADDLYLVRVIAGFTGDSDRQPHVPDIIEDRDSL